MKRTNRRLTLLSAGILATFALAQSAAAQSTGYLVTVNTSSVTGQTGTMDLQFNAGALNTQNACVSVSNFITDGTLNGTAATAGSVTGTLASTLTINNGPGGCTTPATYTSSVVNDYSQPITFGATLSFFVALNGPAVTSPAGNNNGNSGSSFGIDFTVNGASALSTDVSNFAGVITVNPDGSITTTGLPGPNGPSVVTIQAAQLVTVTTAPSGLSFSVDNTTYSTSQTFAWAIGSQHTLAVTSPQGSNGTRETFSSWSDGNTTATDTVTVTAGVTTYTASFNTSYLLTTSVSPSTADGSVGISPASPTNDGYYPASTPVTLTATGNTGYAFSNWTGTTASSTNPLVINMTGPMAETANFVVNSVQVTIGTAPSGLLVSVDGGASQPAPVQVTWQVGTNHTIATTSPQGSNGTRYTFSGWSDAGAISHQVTASSSVTSYTASFGTSYLVTAAVSPTGSGTVGVSAPSPTGDGYYPAATKLTLTANPAANYKFSAWTGTVASSTNPLSVTVNGPISETANFVLNNVQITIGTAPSGLLVRVDNGTAQAAPVVVNWTIGTPHTIAAVSPQGSSGTQYTFASWSDGGAVSHGVTASTAVTLYTATFNTSYLLTTAVNPPGAGTVTPASGTYYPANTVVPLKAAPNNGYKFQKWTGPVANASSASTTVTMTGPETVTAQFTEGPTFLLGTIVAERGPMSNRQWTIGILNFGPGAANNAQITSFSLVQIRGAKCTPVVTTPMPAAFGNLSPGGTAETTVHVNFGSCAADTRFAVNAHLSANSGKAEGFLIVNLQEP